MSKTLELTIFEKEPGRYGREPLYNSPDGFWAYAASHVDGYAANKHLTDAELAAEYWQSGYTDVRYDREDEDLEPIPEIIHRFATLPHYDEVDQ